MANNNFTAGEITSLHNTAEDVFKEIMDAINAVKEACGTLGGIVASDDSGLSGKWNSIADSITAPMKIADGTFGYLGDILKKYVQETISNEQSAENDLNTIDEELGALGQIASGLVDLGSAIGGAASGFVDSKHIDGTPGTYKYGSADYVQNGPMDIKDSTAKKDVPLIKPSEEYHEDGLYKRTTYNNLDPKPGEPTKTVYVEKKPIGREYNRSDHIKVITKTVEAPKSAPTVMPKQEYHYQDGKLQYTVTRDAPGNPYLIKDEK